MLLDRKAFVSALAVNNPVTDQETFLTISGMVANINIQPASPELTILADGETFKTYKAFTTNSGVLEGMLLTVSGTGEVYRVRGREIYNYGAGQHIELVLIKSDVRVP
jgi:hypothetical protein